MTLDVASSYLAITLPATVLLGLGMALASILRAAGDARRAMYVTLAGAIVTAILDPLFYFRPRPWRDWRGHCHHDFTVRCRGRWHKRRRSQT